MKRCIPPKLPASSAAKQRDAEANTSALEQEIDRLVYKLYDLTPDGGGERAAMKLPNADNTVVERDKIVSYLLDYRARGGHATTSHGVSV